MNENDADTLDNLTASFGNVMLYEPFVIAMQDEGIDFEFEHSNFDGTILFRANGYDYKMVISLNEGK